MRKSSFKTLKEYFSQFIKDGSVLYQQNVNEDVYDNCKITISDNMNIAALEAYCDDTVMICHCGCKLKSVVF